MRLFLTAALVVATAFVSSAQSGIGGAAGGAEALMALRGKRQLSSGPIRYRVIDGELAKKIDRYCPGLWLDTDEVLLIEYQTHTFLMRTGYGDIGRACRVE